MKYGHFELLSPSLESLAATYAVHLRLIGKPIVDFLLVIIELFSLGAMVQALQAHIDWQIAENLTEGDVTHQPFVYG